jgi:Cu+-exporting ATPase
VSCARGRRIAISEAREIHAIAGGGAGGQVGHRRVLLGSRSLLAREGIADLERCDGSAGSSTVGVAIDGRLVAVLRLEDPVRPEARGAIEDLKSLGISVALLSGDRAAAVARAAREAGIDQALGDLDPQDKLGALKTWRADAGGVLMIGDGINDAPALAAATAGIAFGAASGLAKQTADTVILRENLHEVPELVVLARRTMRVVRQNLVWAFGYNSVGILMAAFGFLRPVVAAAAMVLSSLFVVGNSLRLQRRRPGAP